MTTHADAQNWMEYGKRAKEGLIIFYIMKMSIYKSRTVEGDANLVSLRWSSAQTPIQRSDLHLSKLKASYPNSYSILALHGNSTLSL